MHKKKYFLKILQLKASNQCLIDLYILYLKIANDTWEDNYEQINLRKQLREKIDEELKDCLKKLDFDSIPLYYKLYFEIFPIGLTLKHHVLKYVNLSNEEYFQQRETKNIRMYYNILYSKNIPTPITDLLLKQKKAIEEYLS